MAEYIDRVPIIKKLEQRMLSPETIFINTVLIRLLEGETVADVVEVKHGYWEFTGRKLTCSVCGHRAYIGTDDKGLLKEEADLRKYCFHCGAKMDGEHNEK